MPDYWEDIKKISYYNYDLKSITNNSTNESTLLEFIDYSKQYKV